MTHLIASRPFASPAPPPVGISIRHMRVPDDYEPMNAVANAARAAGGEDFSTTDEQFVAFYTHLANCDTATDVAIAERDGRIVGYGRVSWHDEPDGGRQYELVIYLLPGEPDEIWLALLDAIEGRAREMAAAGPDRRENTLQLPGGAGRSALLLERGCVPVRYMFAMLRPNLDDLPDAALPDGLEVRPVQ